MTVLDSFAVDRLGVDNFGVDNFGEDDFGAESLGELRAAMEFYGLPGVQYLGELEDLRGDGLEGDGHLGNEAEFLAELGWDPFKAVKKAVKGAVKGVQSVSKAAGSVVRTVAKPVSGIVRHVPVVGNAASKYVNIASQLAYNPLAIARPKELLRQGSEFVAATAPLIPMAKELANSPLVRATALGAAIVFPPIGVPATAALATITAVTKGLDSVVPGVRQAAQQIVKNTAALAKQGNEGAGIALAEMVKHRGAQVATRLTSRRPGMLTGGGPVTRPRVRFRVGPNGRIAQQPVR